MQYLQKRFEKGKEWVEQFTRKNHRIIGLSLMETHADLLQWQRSDSGGVGLLDCSFQVLISISQTQSNSKQILNGEVHNHGIGLQPVAFFPFLGTTQTQCSVHLGSFFKINPATHFPGPLIIDEAIQVAKTICNGDGQSALLALHPIHHASTDQVGTTRPCGLCVCVLFCGGVSEDYWDSSSNAGPAQRPAATFEKVQPTLSVCTVTPTELKCLSGMCSGVVMSESLAQINIFLCCA